ncbi:hypothetical protein SAMN05444166_2211 [Singulisphaera sp. GP187]|uniref:tetratricopeptide repeat protein n=1 Tax=Singulisphaera sp. GP187 TaxID=1882752 RepID=UPI0009287E55|nr:tetratricopeptide repeat protein [Singulisphaera sp. GP187]SIO05211.1 hypothetical protein SAMN05444166_2211 [Singulisphaera sp. GP187]
MSETSGQDRPPSSIETDRALTLVHEGWNHLQLQRPLAAWAAWQRALRIVPELPQAREALACLESASDLPVAARVEHRFQAPDDPEKRSRWDSLIRGGDLEDLAKAADLFASLSIDDPADAAAWFNRALCLAWIGRNGEAISCLDRVVQLRTADDPEKAVAAWTLAEVLRQGAGAETLADDLRFAWVVPWSDQDTPRLIHGCPTLQKKPGPRDPITGVSQFPSAQVFEWLDRPMPEPVSWLTLSDVPRVLATVIITPQSLRLSSPDPLALERVRAPLLQAIGDLQREIVREAAPLPLTLADAAVWTFRRPEALDDETEGRLAREAVERFYEDFWIHLPRHGLGDLSPLQASRAAKAGDPVARVRLTAVVRMREQLGARPRTAILYQGYPFDRLRRRLGLELDNPASVDLDDPSCMSEDDLDRLVLEPLTGPSLAEAYLSATAFGDDRRTARIAAQLLKAPGMDSSRVVNPDLFAVLVREAIRVDNPREAQRWLERGRATHGGRDRRTYDIWDAEIHARTGDPDAASAQYRTLLSEGGLETSQLLDAVEDLLLNGHAEHAGPLLELAKERADREGDPLNIARARSLSREETTDTSAP